MYLAHDDEDLPPQASHGYQAPYHPAPISSHIPSLVLYTTPDLSANRDESRPRTFLLNPMPTRRISITKNQGLHGYQPAACLRSLGFEGVCIWGTRMSISGSRAP
ncbi:hypothetical protein BJ508DRAFT_30419 [Ascobolus immersus RN42]|uniref:Uncharacterized protein n=1 Tax=Ascobolus immersus RN42 TaxID=1160509 RepID=A0A3N4HRP9_ASCIM|nr:hypothetical protein BJ508DRAFT_30419 [Ascobolus immersus RN42]